MPKWHLNLGLLRSGWLRRLFGGNRAGWALPAILSLALAGCGGGRSTTPAPVTPAFGVQPRGVQTSVGRTVTFLVTVTGEPAPSLQWQVSKDGGAIWSPVSGGSGLASASYTTPALTLADDHSLFRVQASNSKGSVLSASALLQVNPALTAPDGLTAVAGDAAALLVFKAVPGAVGYSFSLDPTFTGVTNFAPVGGVMEVGVGPLANGTTYTVTVAAYGPDGAVGPYSAPVAVTPAHGAVASACQPPVEVTTSSASLQAQVVLPANATGTAWFEYGSTTAYGSVTPTQSLGAITSSGIAQSVIAVVQDLAPSAIWHYRLHLQSGSVLQTSQDQSFTTFPAGVQLAGGAGSFCQLLAVDSAFLYYYAVTDTGLGIQRLSLADNSITTLAAPVTLKPAFAVDTLNIYWGEEAPVNGIWSVPRSGARQAVNVVPDVAATSLSSNGNTLFWTDVEPVSGASEDVSVATLKSRPLPLGDTTTLVSLPGSTLALGGLDEANAYLVEDHGPGTYILHSIPLAGGADSLLFQSPYWMTRPLLANGSCYFEASSVTNVVVALYQLNPADGTATVLVPDLAADPTLLYGFWPTDLLTGIAADGSGLYWTSLPAGGFAIQAAALDGSQVRTLTLASSFFFVTPLVDAQYVYWAAFPNGGTGNYAVLRMSR